MYVYLVTQEYDREYDHYIYKNEEDAAKQFKWFVDAVIEESGYNKKEYYDEWNNGYNDILKNGLILDRQYYGIIEKIKVQ